MKMINKCFLASIYSYCLCFITYGGTVDERFDLNNGRALRVDFNAFIAEDEVATAQKQDNNQQCGKDAEPTV